MVATIKRARFGRRARAFANEIAIIVLGVLIALGLGALAEDWAWQRKAADGEARLKVEMRALFGHAAEQVIVKPCILAQLDGLRLRLGEDGQTILPAPLDRFPNNLAVLRLPTRPWSSAIWQALQQDGTATRLSRDKQRVLGFLYNQVENVRHEVLVSGDASGRLLVMGYDQKLSPEMRSALLMTIAEQYRRTEFITRSATQVMGAMRDMGYQPSDGEVSNQLSRGLLASNTVGFCRQRGLPLADWKAELSKVPHLSRRPV